MKPVENVCTTMPRRVTVNIGRHQGKLRLSWTHPAYGRKKLSSGLSADDPKSHLKVEKLAEYIEREISSNQYHPNKHRAYKEMVVGVIESSAVSLQEERVLCDLFAAYTQYKLDTKSIGRGTYRDRYKPILEWLKPFGRDHAAVYDALAKQEHKYIAERKLSLLISAYDWAIMNGVTDYNPFEKKKIPQPNKKKSKRSADPFTVAERDEIINSFENSRHYSYYTNLIKFLFFTGMRPGEAVALHKEDIYPGWIDICRKQSRVEKGYQVVEGLKNADRRKFPINKQVEGIVKRAVMAASLFNTPYLFVGPQGKPISRNNLNGRAWSKTLKDSPVRHINMYTGGKRSLGTTRHTFITLALQQPGVTSALVAEWVGNSIAVIEEHYCNQENQQIKPPYL